MCVRDRNRFNCNFIREGNKLSAPLYEVTLAENGTISEYFDKRAGRQIVCGENFNTLLDAIIKAKPAAAKGQYIRSCVVAATMGPGVKVNPNKVGSAASAE